MTYSFNVCYIAKDGKHGKADVMRLVDAFMESAEVAGGTVGTAVLLGISLVAGFSGYYNHEAAGCFGAGLLGGATLMKAKSLMDAAAARTETIAPQ